jgi:signal transduction histidine kinase
LAVQDSSRPALDLVHQLLTLRPAEQPCLNELLARLAVAFDATGAGFARLFPSAPALRVARGGGPLPDAPLPGDSDPNLLARVREAAGGVVIPCQPRGCVLAAAARPGDGPDFLLWVEDERRSTWTPAEAAALTLFARAFTLPAALADVPPWAEVRERLLRQHRLDQAGRLVRRLAHDFGNVLTSILGFTELSLAQRLPPHSPVLGYLGEVQGTAKTAADWTRLLRLFALSDPVPSRPVSLADAVRAEGVRVRAAWKPGAELVLDLAAGLPGLTADEEHLRQVVHNLLENAHEALPDGRGVVTAAARLLDLTPAACLEYYGRPQPGPHVALSVRDTGTGLAPEVLRRLFAEPFFSTKSRRRGLGLAVVYGIAAANRGGLRVANDPTGGAVAEVVFPAAPVEAAIDNNRVSGVGYREMHDTRHPTPDTRRIRTEIPSQPEGSSE